MTNDETTGRFEITQEGSRYMVRDRETGQPVRFSYDRDQIPFADERSASRWGNFYAARGFAQKLARFHP